MGPGGFFVLFGPFSCSDTGAREITKKTIYLTFTFLFGILDGG